MFVFIVSFIIIFKSIFGEGNTLVGVTVITTALVLMERDLTPAPLRNFMKVLAANLFTLIFSILAIQNPWSGIIFNFIALFTIGYLFSYNLKKSIVVPFGLQYIFMLFYPVEGNVLFNRLLALIFGSVFIMLLQFIVNKDKILKTGNKIIDNIMSNILLKIKAIQSNNDFDKESATIIEGINNLKKVIYDRRVNNYHLTNDAVIATNILWSLEKINILLDSIGNSGNKEECKKLLDDVYNNISVIKNGEFELSDVEAILEHGVGSSKIGIWDIESYIKDVDKEYVNEFINLLNILMKEVNEMKLLGNKPKYFVNNNHEIPEHFNRVTVHKRSLQVDSAKFRYAIRLGVVGTITAFFAQYFNLSEGRWLSLTIFSLIQPYMEISNTRAKDRVQGTIIGGLIVLISFAFIKNQVARTVMILSAGYIDSYTKTYRDKIICVTVSAVASAAIMGHANILVLERVIFIVIGALLTVIANKYILPYKIKDMGNYLVETYNLLIKQMEDDIKEEHSHHSMRNLYLITALIEEKAKLFTNEENKVDLLDFLNNKRNIVNNVYGNYFWEKVIGEIQYDTSIDDICSNIECN